MYTIVKMAHIDAVKWDHCIAQSTQASLYAERWYLNSAAASWIAMIKGDYEAVFPIAEIKKLGMPVAYQPVGLHVLSWYGAATSSDYFSAMDFLSSNYIHVDVNIRADGFLQALQEYAPRKLKTRNLQILDFSRISESNPAASFSNRHRGSLSKAQKNRVKIQKDFSYSDFETTAKQSTAAKKMQIFSNSSHSIREIVESAAEQHKVQIIGATLDSKAISAAVFMECHSKLYLQFIFAIPIGLKYCANHHILKYAIQSHLGKVKELDFGGSNIDSIGHFNRGFGAENVPYLNYRSGLIHTIKRRD